MSEPNRNVWVRKGKHSPTPMPMAMFLEAFKAGGVKRTDQYSYFEHGPWVDVSHHPLIRVLLPDDEFYAAILGISGRVTMSDVRKAYLRQINLYHPDKVGHLGQKLKDLADSETKRINDAFDYFQNRRTQAK